MRDFTKTQKAVASSIAVALIVVVVFLLSHKTVLYIASNAGVQTKAPDTRIILVGDIMMDRSVRIVANKYYKGSFEPFFEDLIRLTNGGVLFGNLEGPVSDVGARVGSIYSFRMETRVFDILSQAGFSVLSFANNHVGDYGRAAYDDTLKRAKLAGIPLAGVRPPKGGDHFVLTNSGNMTIAWLGYTDNGPTWLPADDDSSGVAVLDENTLAQDIKNAAAFSDMVIVSVHWGDEYQTLSNERQQRIAHTAIDAGAQIVVGHHPHVEQEIEEYNNGIIVYSLGNFVFDQNFSPETSTGLVLEILRTNDGQLSYSRHRATFDNHYIPHIEIDYASR